MSVPPEGAVTLKYGDGQHTFRLGIAEVRELQRKTGVGPLVTFNRLRTGEWLVDEPREVIRIGKIGGGGTPLEALQLVETYYDKRPFTESILTAVLILSATLIAPVEERSRTVKKKARRKAQAAQTKTTAGSDTATLTAAPS